MQCLVAETTKEINYARKKMKFFWFPGEASRKAAWFNACGRNPDESVHLKICSEHFREEDYRLKDILMNTEWSKRRLNADAVPCLKLQLQRDDSGTPQEESR